MNQYTSASIHIRHIAVALAFSVIAVRAEDTDSIRFPLLTNCFEDGERIAQVTSTDSIKVRYASVASSRGACYSVTLTKNGRTMTGFLVGATLPAIQQFDAETRRHVPEAPRPVAPAPVAVTAAANAAPPPPARVGPSSLSGLRGEDLKGHFIDLDGMSTQTLVVYFWSASDKRSAKKAEAMESIYGQYHSRRLDVIGVASASNLDQLKAECAQNEVVWTQVVDRGNLAKRFNVDPQNPYMILDRSRNVIAAVASPKELEIELRRLGFK